MKNFFNTSLNRTGLRTVAILTLSLVVQACAPGKSAGNFGTSAGDQGSSTEASTASSSSSSANVNAFKLLPVGIGRNTISITCTSRAGATQTISGSTDGSDLARAIIYHAAPSQMGAWVVEVRAGIIVNAHNCWADAVLATQSDYEFSNDSLCIKYGAGAQVASPYDHYSFGIGTKLLNCSLEMN